MTFIKNIIACMSDNSGRDLPHQQDTMVTCGHQLGCTDHSGWLMSSSAAAPLGGSSNTSQILHKIMADELYEAPAPRRQILSATQTEFLQSKRINLTAAKEREGKFQRLRDERIALRRSKVSCFHNFSDFEESEHNDGCPVKWLFRRQSTESWMSGGSKPQEHGLDGRRTRDKIPREIHIRKIGLKKRQKHNKRSEENENEFGDYEESNRLDDLSVDDDRRSKLESKFNFRTFDDGEDEDEDHHRLPNFLHPRPLTGLRPWICVLLAPRSENQHISIQQSVTSQGTLQKSGDRRPNQNLLYKDIEDEVLYHSPVLSVRSISFPELKVEEVVRKSTPRIRKKKKTKAVSYRSPALLDITLRETKGNKEMEEKAKCEERNTGDIIEEDRFYRLERFFGGATRYVEVGDTQSVKKSSKSRVEITKNPKCGRKAGKECKLLLTSCKVQFFERPGKPMR